MRTILFLMLLSSMLWSANSCLECHEGIEDIRDPGSKMMKAIYKVAGKAGHKGNDCIVCHGGNPTSMVKERAHKGTVRYFKEHKGPKAFYPAPGSTWINQNTCGMCHQEQVASQMNSLMMTGQGKIQGALWSFGADEGYEHSIGTHATKDPEDLHARLGTKQYQTYMEQLAKMEPQGFPEAIHELTAAPTAEEVEKDPSLAVYTYLRQECLRCHTGSKGRQTRGDHRGIGCAACHIPYSNEGRYEGKDTQTSKEESGHLLVHTIQSSRKAKVKVHEVEYSGVPVETCSTCHDRDKRIGLSYQGLMETEHLSAFDENGDRRPRLQVERYLHLKEDVHYQKGMLCQDCHTSNDLHGDGFLSGANLGAVEIECQDCHGTTSKFPWELPLGYSDEFNTTAKSGAGRGVTKTVADHLKKGFVSDPQEGHLLSARGNPLVHTARQGDQVIIHLASGKDIRLKPLKALKKEKKLSKKALIAMDRISTHTEDMECYSCHAPWAPQYYGDHVKIDYSEGKQDIDYLAASHDQDVQGTTGGMRDLKQYLIDGQVTETHAYLRWEDPALSQNGEGRISPTIPGRQSTITVIAKDGRALLQEHIFKVPDVEGAGEVGQNAIDMSPVQPHTIAKEARSCESCHVSEKAMGLGIGGGKYDGDLRSDRIVDLMTADGKVLPQHVDVQIPKIAGLKDGYSRFIDENGTQLQTVGHHWTLSRPLDEQQRAKLDRRGVCLSCHKSIPDGDLAITAMAHAAQMAGVEIDNEEHANILSRLLHISAWAQVTVGVLMVMTVLYLLLRPRKKRRRWR